jgi:hypothetical protein
MTFNSLTYARKLKEVGFTESQAEVQAEALASIVESELATERDLKETEAALKRDIKDVETVLKRDIKDVEVRLEAKLAENQSRAYQMAGWASVCAGRVYHRHAEVISVDSPGLT